MNTATQRYSGPAIAARWGKPAAELADNAEVWALEGDYLGQMCANLVLMYSPRRIVLGGGVMHQEQLYGIVRKKTLEYLGGYIQTAELKDIESYICAPGCGGDNVKRASKSRACSASCGSHSTS